MGVGSLYFALPHVIKRTQVLARRQASTVTCDWQCEACPCLKGLGFAGKMPALHSHLAAPGLVMAVGNVGEYLDFAADATCTFLSRDGGETW